MRACASAPMGGSSCLTQARGLKFTVLILACGCTVVPHAGTWIEIYYPPGYRLAATSCLTQARGLKCRRSCLCGGGEVVPHAGTWIEICLTGYILKTLLVVPHAGTWIEILDLERVGTLLSRASRRHVD